MEISNGPIVIMTDTEKSFPVQQDVSTCPIIPELYSHSRREKKLCSFDLQEHEIQELQEADLCQINMEAH